MSQSTYIFFTCNGIKRLKRIGPKTEPCGTPNFTESSEEEVPRSKTHCIMFSRYDLEMVEKISFKINGDLLH